MIACTAFFDIFVPCGTMNSVVLPSVARGDARKLAHALQASASSSAFSTQDTSCIADAELRVGTKSRQAAFERGFEHEWTKAADMLCQACQVDQEVADKWLSKAFGWSLWINAGRPAYLESRAIVPNPLELAHDLDWLTTGPLQLNSTALRYVVETAAGAALRYPQKRYNSSFAIAPEHLKSTFLSVVRRDPKVLELVWDCAGACQARCSQCWRTSKYR